MKGLVYFFIALKECVRTTFYRTTEIVVCERSITVINVDEVLCGFRNFLFHQEVKQNSLIIYKIIYADLNLNLIKKKKLVQKFIFNS